MDEHESLGWLLMELNSAIKDYGMIFDEIANRTIAEVQAIYNVEEQRRIAFLNLVKNQGEQIVRFEDEIETDGSI